MLTDKNSLAEDVRRTEALFLFGAALPPRDEFDENLYREWHERDARRPGREVYGRSPHLRSLTRAELHHIAMDNVQAQAERAAKPRQKPRQRQRQKLDSDRRRTTL